MWPVPCRCPRGCLNIKMPSYHYRVYHYKDKIVLWPCGLYNVNPHTWKDCLYIEMGSRILAYLYNVNANPHTWKDCRYIEIGAQAPRITRSSVIIMTIWQITSKVIGHIDGLTHWGRGKMADIFWTTFPNAFSWMKMYDSQSRFHWKLFLRVQLTIFQLWFG